MDTSSLLHIARTQLETLKSMTDDREAIIRLHLALEALGAEAEDHKVTVVDSPVQGQSVTTLHVVDGNDSLHIREVTNRFARHGSDHYQDPIEVSADGAYHYMGEGEDGDNEDGEYDEGLVDAPAGFASREAYEEFLAFQDAALDAADDHNRRNYGRPDGVVGIDDDGNDLGNADAMVARANAMVHDDYDDEEDGYGDNEVEEFRVSYTRQDNAPLTRQQVQSILDSQASQSLHTLGTVQSFRIVDGESDAQKVAVFRFDTDGLDLETIARGFVTYRGVKVFPGIGRVLAVGEAA